MHLTLTSPVQSSGRFFTRGNVRGYRFGFNGKERDDEGMGGGGSTYDYGFRIYNPQIGRFLSVDPLFRSFPWYTPFQFAGNMPIWCIDGLEEAKATMKYTVEIWENGVKLPDGSERTVGYTNYKAGTTVIQQGDEGGDVRTHLVKVSGTQNGPHVSERIIIESPTPALKPTNADEVSQTTEMAKTTATNDPPPTPPIATPDEGSSKLGTKLFNKDIPEPGGHPLWVRGNATFESDSWKITNPGTMKSTLDPIADVLKSDPNLRITIYGNTNDADLTWDSPTRVPGVSNKQLALNRAGAIKELLINEYGIDPKQIKTSTANNTGGGMSANYSITNQTPK